MNFVLAQTQLAYYLPAERLKGHCIGIVAQFKLILALNYFIYELLVFNKLGFLLNFLISASRVCRDLFLNELKINPIKKGLYGHCYSNLKNKCFTELF